MATQSSMGGEETTINRMVVSQSQPLVQMRGQIFEKFGLPPDHERERALFLDLFQGSKPFNNVVYETATKNRLEEILKADDSGILHFSGHACDYYLALESRGAMDPLYIPQLKDMLEMYGVGGLKLVFLSACSSLEAGKAFENVKIPHVICCKGKLWADDALEFTRVFYAMLATGTSTVIEAFNVAKHGIENSNFVLLPEQSDRHDSVFKFCDKPAARILPSYPREFFGREQSMYQVIYRLLKYHFVQITGRPGVGKTTLAEAVCAYIKKRRDDFPQFEEVFWLPSRGHNHDGDQVMGGLHQVMEAVLSGETTLNSNEFVSLCERTAESLHGVSSLIFIDCSCPKKSLVDTKSIDKLFYFLKTLDLVESQNAHIVLINHSGQGQGMDCEKPRFDRLDVKPLDMEASVKLFGVECRWVNEGLGRSLFTPRRLADFLVLPEYAAATRANDLMTKRSSDIFASIGAGNPVDIRNKADITEEDFDKLINGGYESRYQLELDIDRAEKEFQCANRHQDPGQAAMHRTRRAELEKLREVLPHRDDLKAKKRELQREMASSENPHEAISLQTQVDNLTKKIKKEEEAELQRYENREDEKRREEEQVTRLHNSPGDCPLPPREFIVTPTGSGSRPFTLSVSHSSVLDFKSDKDRTAAIVCATNESCRRTCEESVARAVEDKGGSDFRQKVQHLEPVERNNWGDVRCPTGEAKVIGPPTRESGTTFGDLNVAFVIFAVGPTYATDDNHESLERKDKLLREAYKSSLECAKEKKLEAIGISLISAGNRSGGNLSKILRIALETISAFPGYDELKKVELCAYGKQEFLDLMHITNDLVQSSKTLSCS